MRGKMTTVIAIVIFIAGLSILIYPHAKDYLDEKKHDEQVQQYKHQQAKEQKEASDKQKDNEKDKKQQEKDQKVKKSDKPVGYIEIKDADIKEPVYNGPATPKQLDKGVSLADKNEYKNDQNIAIAGHTDEIKDGYQFSDLKKKAHKGTKVKFSLGDDKEYEIKSIKNVNPEDTDVLKNKKKDYQELTLITCDDYNPETGNWEKRTVYKAKEVS